MEKSNHKAAFFMITLLLISTLMNGLGRPAIAQTTTRIYLSPSAIMLDTSSYRVGDRFNVTVRADDIPVDSGATAWEIYLKFDDTVINVTRWFEPKTDSQYIFVNETTTANPTPPDNPGYIHVSGWGVAHVSASLFPASQQPASGNRLLCIFEFAVAALPPAGGSLSSALVLDPGNTFLLAFDLSTIPSTLENGSYTLTFTSLPSPYLVVSPSLTRFSAYENVVGKQFNVTIVATGVDPAHGLDSASAVLAYNQTLLTTESANVIVSSLWSQNTTTVANGEANILVSNPSSLPAGTVPLCTVGFTITQQEQSPPDLLGSSVNTTLEIISSGFHGSAGNIPAATPQNATIRIYAYQAAITKLVLKPFIIDTRIPRPDGLYRTNITITDVYDLHSIQVRLLFDPNVLNLTNLVVDGSIRFGDTLGAYAYSINIEANLTAGYVTINTTADAPIPLISGTLYEVTFNATGLTPVLTFLNFSQPYGVETLAVDSLGTTIPLIYGGVGLDSEFVWTPSNPGIVTTIQFNDTSSMPGGHIVGWFWDFGDGTTSTFQNATHRFAEYNKDYYVNLTITGEDNSTTWVVNRVHIYVLPPTISFYTLPANVQTGNPIRFADNSTDPQNLNLTSWFWDFGDGANSTDQNPYHTYDKQGDYNVTLTVGNNQSVSGTGFKIISVTRLSTFELPVWSLFVIIIAIAAVVLFVLNYIRKRRMAVPVEEER